MAYEYGTLDISYDSNNDGKRREFKAVILNVYKAGKDGVCRKVAGTREPLPDQENSARPTADPERFKLTCTTDPVPQR
jgi:hypothetical protein